MNSSATIRLPGFAVNDNTTSEAKAAAPVPDVEVCDEALMAQICEGGREALAIIFRRYAHLVRGVAYRVLRDASEADDLLQDVFILVHRLCRTFDGSRSPAKFWILQITYRRAISRRRYLTSRHFYTRLDLDDTVSELADPRTSAGQLGDSIDGRLGNGGLQGVFEALSENQRRTLRLFFIEGYTLDEIATKIGQSRGNVKHHYFRGLDRLRKEFFGGKLPRERSVWYKVLSNLGAGALSRTEPHDEFLELCAVSTSGQLTEEEQKKLQEHLAVCQSCRETLRQYEAVVGQAIPAVAANEEPESAESGPSWSQEEAEKAFFKRLAQAEKREPNKFSGASDLPSVPHRPPRSPMA
jgi:RNA polymerase sigma-70 factor, ECF subfamily